MANEHDQAKWTEGTILFGGKELHMVTAGSTADAAPVGIGGNMTNDVKYTVFWDRKNPAIFQTVVESAYVPTEERVVVMEVTGATLGEEVQLVSRDVQQVGNNDKLNSESFNKIVAGEFATGALTGVDNLGGSGPPYTPGAGVVLDSNGLSAYDGTSVGYLMHLSSADLRFYKSEAFVDANSSGRLSAVYSGSAVTYYDQSHFNALDADRLSQFSSTGLTFFGTDGTTTRATVTPTGLTLIGDGAATNQPFGITIRADNNSYGNGMFQWQREDSHVVANHFVHISGGVDYLTTTVENTVDDPKGLLYNVFGGETRWIKTNHVLQSAGSLAPYSTTLEWEYSADNGITTRGLRFAMTRTPAWTANTTQTLQLPVDIPAAGEVLTVSTGGVNLEWASSGVMDDWLVRADSGGAWIISDGETLDLTGGTGITTVATDGYVTFNLIAANTTFTSISNASLAYVRGGGGSVSAPTFSFTADTDTGINNPSNDHLSLTAGSGSISVSKNVYSGVHTMGIYPANGGDGIVSDGTSTAPYANLGAYPTTSGWYNQGFNAVVAYYFRIGDGSSSYPALSFYNDINTGFYRIASGHTGYSDDGTLRVNFGGHTFATTDSSGASTVNPEFSVAGTGAFSSYLYVGELRPASDNVSDIGTSTRRFDNIFATNSTISTSDIRAKENISPSTLGLDFINDLNPVSYQWKAIQDKKLNQTHYGIIAQEVIETLKKYGIDSLDDFGGIYGDEETYYGARYSEFVPILMKAVQELSVEIKELKEKN